MRKSRTMKNQVHPTEFQRSRRLLHQQALLSKGFYIGDVNHNNHTALSSSQHFCSIINLQCAIHMLEADHLLHILLAMLTKSTLIIGTVGLIGPMYCKRRFMVIGTG